MRFVQSSKPRHPQSHWRAVVLAVASLTAASVFAGAPTKESQSLPNPLAQRVDAVVMKGKDLGELMGADLEAFNLLAVNSRGELTQIPFQVDERFESGELILIPNKLPGTGRLTRQDELVFMARDAGFKIPSLGMLPSSSASREIEISDPGSGEKAWVYAVVSPIPSFRTPVSYVSYDAGDRRVTGANYLMHFPSEGEHSTTPFWQADQFSVLERTQAGGNSFSFSSNLVKRDILDIHLATLAGMLSWNLSAADLDTKEVGQKIGPVRAIRKIRLHPKLGYGLRASPVTVEQTFFDRFTMMDVAGEGKGLGVLSKADVIFGEEVNVAANDGRALSQDAPDVVRMSVGDHQALALWRFASDSVSLKVTAGEASCPSCVLVAMDGKQFAEGRFHFVVQRFFSERADEEAVRAFLKMTDQPLRVRSKSIEQNLVLRLQ